MKSYMILGSVVGFLIGAGFSLAGDCSWSTALWRASVASLVGALLVRWWGRVWLQGLRETLEQRHHTRSIPPVNPKPAAKI
jgi:Na+-driven multidrug efflux pump